MNEIGIANKIYALINDGNKNGNYILITDSHSAATNLSHPHLNWFTVAQLEAHYSKGFANGEQIYYYFHEHSFRNINDLFSTALDIIFKLIKDGINVKIIYDVQGSSSTVQSNYSAQPMFVMSPDIFFAYAPYKYPGPLVDFFKNRQKEYLVTFLYNPQSHFFSFVTFLNNLTLLYATPKVKIESFISFWVYTLSRVYGDIQVVHVLEDKQSVSGIEPCFYGVSSDRVIERKYHRINLDNTALDIFTEKGQMQINSDLMRIETDIRKNSPYIYKKLFMYNSLSVRVKNTDTISLIILDSLSAMENMAINSNAISMSQWLEQLQDKGIAVIVIPPDMATAEALKHSTMFQWDNIINVGKDNPYDSSKTAISLYYEQFYENNHFVTPETWEYFPNAIHRQWQKVINRTEEDVARANELRRYVKRKLTNKEIANILGKSETLVKKLRRKYNLSKPQKRRSQKRVLDSLKNKAKRNENVYEIINRFLKKHSLETFKLTRQPFFDDKIMDMHQDGLSHREIRDKIYNEYEIKIPLRLIVRETEAIDNAQAWLTRSLDPLYPILFINRIKVQCREGSKSLDKVLSLASAVTRSGKKELLGMWFTDDDNEKFAQKMVNDLKQRGMTYFLIACVDESLENSSDIIRDSFIGGDIQRDISDIITDSITSVTKKNRKAVNTDIFKAFTANTKHTADKLLSELAEKWENEYLCISQLQDNWDMLEPFFKYTPEIRKLIYTYKTVDFVKEALDRLQRIESLLPTENAMARLLYWELSSFSGKEAKSVSNWEAIQNQLEVVFSGFSQYKKNIK